MPTLPTVSANRNVQPIQAAPLRQEAAQMAENQNKITGTITKIAQAWSDAHDQIQLTQAKANANAALEQTKMAMINDTRPPSAQNEKEYYDAINKVKENAVSGIDNKMVATQARLEIDHDADITAIQLGGLYKKKTIDYARGVVIPQAMTAHQTAMISAANENVYTQKRDAMFNDVDANVQKGLLDFTEGEKLKKDTLYGAAESAVYSNPIVGMNQINSGRYDLDAEQKTKLTEKAQELLKKREEMDKYQLKVTNTQGALELSQDLYNGTLDHNKIRFLQQSGKINSETAAIFDAIALKKNITIPASTSLAEPDFFVNLLNESLEFGDISQTQKVLIDASQAYGDNKMGSQQYAYFVSQANAAFQRQAKGLTGLSKSQVAMKGAMNGLKSFNSTINPLSTENKRTWSSLASQFMSRFKEGDDPEKIKNEVIDEHLKSKMQQQLNIENLPANITQAEAFNLLKIDPSGQPIDDGMVTVVSSSGQLGQESNQTGMENIKTNTVKFLYNFTQAYGIPVVVTGATEKGHAVGEKSHGSGDKVDLRSDENKAKNKQEKKDIQDLNNKVKSWGVSRYRTVKGKKESGYVDPQSGSIFWKENDHWDVEVNNKFANSDRVPMLDPSGKRVRVKSSQYQDALNKGYKPL
jgi:hypothetical protein